MTETTTAMANLSHGAGRLLPGRPVEVRTRFEEGRWARGFEVAAAATSGGYRIRRRADGSELPVEFPAADVRPDPGSPAAVDGG